MKINKDQFYLRLIQKGDAQQLLDFELRNKDFFTKTSPTRSDSFYTLEGKEAFVQSQVKAIENNEGYSFLMFDYQDHLIGWVSLFELLLVPSLNCCYIGYRIDEKMQGKGYTTLAVKEVIDFAFNTLKLHRLEAGVLLKNKASQRVLEKCGFIQEGIQHKNVNINGVWEDHYMYGLLNPKDY